jgi:hypothetical protein
LLVAAIHELPAAAPDLLVQADELCAYIYQQQRANGALVDADVGDIEKASAEAREAQNHYAGLALYGLLRSQRDRPAAWKLEVARKARAYYQQAWETNKQLLMVPAHTAAYIEVYLLTKEPEFAESITQMNDWLCTLQYNELDPAQVTWHGGFKGWAGGQPLQVAPSISSAACAESLADACRLTRATGDVQRHPRYVTALEKSLQHLTTLQFSEGNTGHFAGWYRREILGGFFASHQDGTLRIEYTQHAVGALLGYLANR